MKKPLIIVIILVIIGVAVWGLGGKKGTAPAPADENTGLPATVSAPVSETTKVSDKLSLYKNEELGFSVKYPSAWDAGVTDVGATFVIPTTKASTNTIKKLEAKIAVASGKCTFPPVTTIKDRGTLKSGTLTFNTISMSNSVQGTNYFDRMYSLPKDNVCYYFTFSSITVSPASKGLKGSEATQITNNNKAIIDAADLAFTEMVKSFTFITGAAGTDETQVVPTKK